MQQSCVKCYSIMSFTYHTTILVILLVVHSVLAQECRRDYQLLNDRQVINVTSPNYPNPYVQGTNCRYRITAPMDHIVVVTCYFEVVS